MAHTIQLARQVDAQPWYIETDDATTRTYLDGISAATAGLKSETASALWATKLATGKYIVSAEAYKRATTGRLT